MAKEIILDKFSRKLLDIFHLNIRRVLLFAYRYLGVIVNHQPQI